MIEDRLREVQRSVPGLGAVLLVDRDGMLVAGVDGDGGAVEVVAANYADIVRRASRANREASLDPVAELIVTAGSAAVLYRGLGEGYGLLAMASPQALLGQVRFALYRAATALEPELVG